MPTTRHSSKGGPSKKGLDAKKGPGTCSYHAGDKQTSSMSRGSGQSSRNVKKGNQLKYVIKDTKDRGETSAAVASVKRNASTTSKAGCGDKFHLEIESEPMALNEGEKEPRRSGRQRTVSKKLQDMKDDLGRRKGKRTQDGKPGSAPTLKKPKQCSPHIRASNTAVKDTEHPYSRAKAKGQTSLTAVKSTKTLSSQKLDTLSCDADLIEDDMDHSQEKAEASCCEDENKQDGQSMECQQANQSMPIAEMDLMDEASEGNQTTVGGNITYESEMPLGAKHDDSVESAEAKDEKTLEQHLEIINCPDDMKGAQQSSLDNDELILHDDSKQDIPSTESVEFSSISAVGENVTKATQACSALSDIAMHASNSVGESISSDSIKDKSQNSFESTYTRVNVTDASEIVVSNNITSSGNLSTDCNITTSLCVTSSSPSLCTISSTSSNTTSVTTSKTTDICHTVVTTGNRTDSRFVGRDNVTVISANPAVYSKMPIAANMPKFTVCIVTTTGTMVPNVVLSSIPPSSTSHKVTDTSRVVSGKTDTVTSVTFSTCTTPSASINQSKQTDTHPQSRTTNGSNQLINEPNKSEVTSQSTVIPESPSLSETLSIASERTPSLDEFDEQQNIWEHENESECNIFSQVPEIISMTATQDKTDTDGLTKTSGVPKEEEKGGSSDIHAKAGKQRGIHVDSSKNSLMPDVNTNKSDIKIVEGNSAVPTNSKIKIVSLNTPSGNNGIDSQSNIKLESGLQSEEKAFSNEMGMQSGTKTREKIICLEDGTELTFLYQVSENEAKKETQKKCSGKETTQTEPSSYSGGCDKPLASPKGNVDISQVCEYSSSSSGENMGSSSQEDSRTALNPEENADVPDIPIQGLQLSNIMAAVANAVKVTAQGEGLAFLVKGQETQPIELSQAQDLLYKSKMNAVKVVAKKRQKDSSLLVGKSEKPFGKIEGKTGKDRQALSDGSTAEEQDQNQGIPEEKELNLDLIVDEEAESRETNGQSKYGLRLVRDILLAPNVVGEDSYGCPLCPYITTKKANWYKHKKTHVGQRSYPCKLCNSVFKSSSNLKRHSLIHTGIKDHECSYCGKRFRQKVQLLRHIAYIHQPKTVKCGICDYTCASVNPDLKIHMMRRHLFQTDIDKARMAFTCRECHFTALNSKDLKQHQKFHKAGPELKFFCPQCSFVTDCESRLKRHEMTHTKERPFSCGMCKYRASQKEHLLRHMKIKHKMDIVRPKGRFKKKCIQDNQIESLTSIDCQQQEITPMPSNDVESPSSKAVRLQSIGSEMNEGHSDLEHVESIDFAQVKDKNETKQGIKVEDSYENNEVEGDDTISNEEISDQSTEEHIETTQLEDSEKEQNQENQSQDAEPGNQDVSHLTGPFYDNEEANTSTHSSSIFFPDLHKRDNTYQPHAHKYYAPVNYTQREKVFSCSHCSMKFAKLISLYKHLNVQHSEEMSCNQDGFYSCVICDYRTTKRNNLLVHMRKHSNREGGDSVPHRGVQQIYSCMICNYSNFRRSALQQHMRRCHDMKIILGKSGQGSCLVLNTSNVTGYESENAAQVLQQVAAGEAMLSTASSGFLSMTGGSTVMPDIKENNPGRSGKDYSDTTEHGPQLNEVQVTGPDGTTQTVVVEMDPAASQQQVTEISEMDTSAVDAIEGLQALAEQVANPREQPKSDETEGASEGMQISSEDLLKLHVSSGDIIEINGEMYKVEFSQEDS